MSGGLIELKESDKVADNESLFLDKNGNEYITRPVKTQKDVVDIWTEFALKEIDITEVRMSKNQLSDFNKSLGPTRYVIDKDGNILDTYVV